MGLKKQQHVISLVLIVLIFLQLQCFSMTSTPVCSRKPVIFNFGDSNSDTGGYAFGFGLTSEVGPPNGREFFHHPSGRPCDGRLILDFLSEDLQSPYLTPYLEPLQPNFTNGVNFALNGAAILSRTTPFNIDVQLAQFLRFRQLSPDLAKQGYKNMISEEEFANAVYMIDIGQNDLAFQFLASNLTLDQVVQKIPSFIAELKKTIKSLHDQGGAINFWIHNTGPFGCLPLYIVRTPHSAKDLDELGCFKIYNDAAKEFNQQLSKMTEELRSEIANATMVYVDIYSIKLDLFTNAKTYGFGDPFLSCCGSGGPPYNYDPSAFCGQNGSNVCEEGSKIVVWDGVHYAEAGNQFVASKIVSTNYSTPAIPLTQFCKVPRKKKQI